MPKSAEQKAQDKAAKAQEALKNQAKEMAELKKELEAAKKQNEELQKVKDEFDEAIAEADRHQAEEQEAMDETPVVLDSIEDLAKAERKAAADDGITIVNNTGATLMAFGIRVESEKPTKVSKRVAAQLKKAFAGKISEL